MKRLPKIVASRQKRVGRGYGSGKGGHTSGRGQKGQKARSKIHILFEGFKVRKSLAKRLPIARGKGKFLSKAKLLTLKTSDLNVFKDGDKVTLESIIKKGLFSKREVLGRGVKILGQGTLKTKKLTVSLPASKKAVEKINKAGGKIA